MKAGIEEIADLREWATTLAARTFGQMVKHLSATNHILAAAALGEEPPADAGDEVRPEGVRTKG
jgi:hypothetical protein